MVLGRSWPARARAARPRRAEHVAQLPLRRHRPANGRLLRPLPLRGERLGRPGDDGRQHRQICPHANCRNTPVEIFETRWPWITSATAQRRRRRSRGAPGRARHHASASVEADEIIVSALCDRSKAALGRVRGRRRRPTRLPRATTSARTRSARSRRASGRRATRSSRTSAAPRRRVRLRSPSGGGYGPRSASRRSRSRRTSRGLRHRASGAPPTTASSPERGRQRRPEETATCGARGGPAWPGSSARRLARARRSSTAR